MSLAARVHPHEGMNTKPMTKEATMDKQEMKDLAGDLGMVVFLVALFAPFIISLFLAR